MPSNAFLPLPNLSWSNFPNCRFQTLFDPVQTHGLYGLTEDNLQQAKDMLKSLGAKRFRVVKCRSGYRILCFKWLKKDVASC